MSRPSSVSLFLYSLLVRNWLPDNRRSNKHHHANGAASATTAQQAAAVAMLCVRREWGLGERGRLQRAGHPAHAPPARELPAD